MTYKLFLKPKAVTKIKRLKAGAWSYCPDNPITYEVNVFIPLINEWIVANLEGKVRCGKSRDVFVPQAGKWVRDRYYADFSRASDMIFFKLRFGEYLLGYNPLVGQSYIGG